MLGIPEKFQFSHTFSMGRFQNSSDIQFCTHFSMEMVIILNSEQKYQSYMSEHGLQ